jgi:excisionase family DNA binding protein
MNPVLMETNLHRPSMRVAKAAALLEVDISTIYKMVRSGVLEAHRVGKRGVRVFADSLRRYQEQQKISTGKDQQQLSQASENKGNSSNNPAHREAVNYLQSIGCL